MYQNAMTSEPDFILRAVGDIIAEWDAATLAMIEAMVEARQKISAAPPRDPLMIKAMLRDLVAIRSDYLAPPSARVRAEALRAVIETYPQDFKTIRDRVERAALLAVMEAEAALPDGAETDGPTLIVNDTGRA